MGWIRRIGNAIGDATDRLAADPNQSVLGDAPGDEHTTEAVDEPALELLSPFDDLSQVTNEELIERLHSAIEAVARASFAYDHKVQMAEAAIELPDRFDAALQEQTDAGARFLESEHELQSILNEMMESPERLSIRGRARTTGLFSVTVSAPPDPLNAGWQLVEAVAICHGGFPVSEASVLAQRVRHMGPQVVAAEISFDEAVLLKTYFGYVGTSARISEAPAAVARDGRRRETIPEAVRHEA